jgi:lysophospholipase L1-like esterase
MGPFRDHAAKLRYDASKVKVICEGNSLVFGYGATNQATMSFPKQLQRLPLLSAAGITVTNLGVGGSTFKDLNSMTARAGAVDALYEAGKSHVLLIWEGTNTIWNNAAYSGADAGQQCWDYVAARRAAMPGVKIVLLTTLPRYAGQNAQYGSDLITPNNKLIAYDNFLKAHWRDMGAAGIVDVRASGVFKESGTNNQPQAWRPYNTDLVHLNDAGYGLVAQYCEPVLRHLVAR